MLGRRMAIALLLMATAAHLVFAQDVDKFQYLRRSIRHSRGVTPPHGVLPGEQEAIALAKLVIPVVLPRVHLDDLAFSAKEEGGKWLVVGTKAGQHNGDVFCQLRRADGAVLYVGFTE